MKKIVYVLLSPVDGMVIDHTFNPELVSGMLDANSYDHEEFHKGGDKKNFGFHTFTFEGFVERMKSSSTNINEE